jgi:hypothetical protein
LHTPACDHHSQAEEETRAEEPSLLAVRLLVVWHLKIIFRQSKNLLVVEDSIPLPNKQVE